jgi:hypothetical protein
MGKIKEEYLMKVVEKEEVARKGIEEKLAPRFLSQAQQKLLIDKLKGFAGTSIDITAYPERGPDILPLKELIQYILRAAGWNVRGSRVIGSGEYVRGIIIITRPGIDKNSENAATMLINGLNFEGIVTNVVPFNEFNKPSEPGENAPIIMLIGIKP